MRSTGVEADDELEVKDEEPSSKAQFGQYLSVSTTSCLHCGQAG